jgi:hypothetical protein
MMLSEPIVVVASLARPSTLWRRECRRRVERTLGWMTAVEANMAESSSEQFFPAALDVPRGVNVVEILYTFPRTRDADRLRFRPTAT